MPPQSARPWSRWVGRERGLPGSPPSRPLFRRPVSLAVLPSTDKNSAEQSTRILGRQSRPMGYLRRFGLEPLQARSLGWRPLTRESAFDRALGRRRPGGW